MIIKTIQADGFRNLKGVDISLHPKLNILCGSNAQGKTNLLEALWLCTGERSFRGAKDRELIAADGKKLALSTEFEDNRRVQTIDYSFSRNDMRNKKIALNGVNLKTPSELFGKLRCVIFTPEDLSLSKGSPDNRRSFADQSVSQLKLSYRNVVDKYKRILEQRNLQLKLISSGKSDDSMLDIWDTQLSQMGAYITMLRYNYCKKLNTTASALYDEISSGKEKLEIVYSSTVYKELEGRIDYKGDLAEEYYRKLTGSRSDDIRAGFTIHGVHRDDLLCSINGMSAKEYASQGQHRSIALIMKLSQAYILGEEMCDPPCILLDDVLSELDTARQSFVMNKIKGMQVLITCCDESLLNFDEGTVFSVSSGQIKTN